MAESGQSLPMARALAMLSQMSRVGGRVVGMDEPARALIAQTRAGAETLPQYVQTLEKAEAQPDMVNVFTERRHPGEEWGRYWWGEGVRPGTILVDRAGLPTGGARQQMSAQGPQTPEARAQQSTTNPYYLYNTPEYGRPEHVLSHELAHFLAEQYGLDLGPWMDERLAQHQATQPMDYPLLRAAWELAQAQGQTETPYWQAVRRQMEGVRR